MSFNLNNVVPWGRSLKEYSGMFRLDEEYLKKRILDCGGGPSSFNAEMSARGGTVVSCDPLYQHTREEIRDRISETYDQVLKETIKNQEHYIWETIKNPAELGKTRMSAMQRFLADYEKGKEEGRYIPAGLPKLPFADKEFHLALSSHFLFLYTDILSFEFHRDAIAEMCRIAKEVRIFPLLDLSNRKSKYVPPLISAMKNKFQLELVNVNYEFQKGANQMLRITANNQ